MNFGNLFNQINRNEDSATGDNSPLAIDGWGNTGLSDLSDGAGDDINAEMSIIGVFRYYE